MERQNQTAADNPEWLDLFKKAHGLNFIPTQIGGQGSQVPEDIEVRVVLIMYRPHTLRGSRHLVTSALGSHLHCNSMLTTNASSVHIESIPAPGQVPINKPNRNSASSMKSSRPNAPFTMAINDANTLLALIILSTSALSSN